MGDIAEVIVYNRLLSDVERRQVDAYLSAKYAIATSNYNSYVWVQVPSFSNNCYIWAKWGDATQTNQPASCTNGATWDSSFSGVWHMKETSPLDSTTNVNNGTVHVNTNAVGLVGGCQGFNGVAGTYVSIPDSPSLSFTTGGLTISAWLRLNSDQSGERAILRKETQWALELFPSGDALRNLITASPTTGWTVANDQAYTINAATWYYFAMAWGTPVLKHVVNGVQQGGDKTVSATITDNGNDLAIGANTGGATLNVDGQIDELRIENITRSTNWLWACWLNMASNSFFNTPGAVQAGGGSIQNLAPTAITNTAAVLNATLSCSGTNYDVWVHWGTADGTNNFDAWATSVSVGSYNNVALTNISYTNTFLTGNTTYYYTFRATNSTTNVWATPSWRFSTPPSGEDVNFTMMIIE